MDHTPPTFDEGILFEPDSFKRWAGFQDCLIRRYREPASKAITYGDHLRSILNKRSGKIIFHGRYSKWDHTRDFWAPLGTVDKVLTQSANRPVHCDRKDLLDWLRDHPQVRRARPGAGSMERGDYEATGANCFQLLRITLESDEFGYFYRPNFAAEAWQKFLNEEIPERPWRRNEQGASAWK